jgi:polyisoprenoid-binding protein YceI
VALVALCLTPALASAQSAARDSVVYLISPASRLEVRTGRAGLLSFAGHEPVIRARAFSGRVVYHPDAPAASRVEVTVLTGRLEVLTLVGRSRDVSVDVGLAVRADTLRATATFPVKQSDFGITPYRGGPAGTVRVADTVRFQILVVAVRRTGRSNP